MVQYCLYLYLKQICKIKFKYGGNLALRSRVLFHLAPLVRKSLSILIEPELSEPKARTRAKQFARSSPHKKKGRLTTDSFFNVWRWRDREYAYRPRLKIFSSKNFGLATDSLILFANKMMLRRSIPARRVCRHSAHLHTKKQKAPNGANVFTCGDGGNRTRVRRELLYKSTCLIYSMV